MIVPLVDNRLLRLLPIILVGLFFVVLIRTAWVCDDAFITFRIVDNFVNGYGLRWNVDERVQAYTNPLWMFVLSGFYFFTREIYFTSIAVSIFLSMVSVYLLGFKIAKTHFSALVALIILIFSKAFVDFTASGLENPLTYLFIALFFMVYLKEDTHHTIFLLAFIAALAMLTRLDNIILLIPTLVWVLWKNRSWKTVGLMATGFLPLFVWELFSLIYYGFLVPNTAYAKLNIGIPSHELWQRGFVYLQDSLSRDPITLLTIGVAFLLPFVTKQWKLLPPVFGILLSLIYTVKIGGDFMTGRFLTASFFTAVITLSQYPWCCYRTPLLSVLGLELLLLLGFYSPNPPLLSGKEYKMEGYPYPIIDERGYYYPYSGLLWALSGVQVPNHPWAIEGQSVWHGKSAVIIRPTIGLVGFYAGPELYIIDPFALSDPFLARLPTKLQPWWQPAHIWRTIPKGYLESVRQGKNVIADKNLAHLYDKVSLVTRGELFNPDRWRAIWFLNFGNYQNLIAKSNADKSDPGVASTQPAFFDYETWILTLPEVTISETETYTAKLRMDLNSLYMYELVNFSPLINRAHYYDPKTGRIHLPEVKTVGMEGSSEMELTLVDHPMTDSSRFVTTSVIPK
jgi:arabinofuranosyltransferase